MSGKTWRLLMSVFRFILLFLLENNFIILESKSDVDGEEERIFVT